MQRPGAAKLRALLLTALAAGVLFACAPKAQPVMALPQPSASLSPAPAASPAASPAIAPLDRLCACAWVDVYDSAFILSFDKLGSKMVERNDPAGIRRSSRVTVEEEAILLYDDLGQLTARLPYTLTEDSLSIDYGESLGTLEYRAFR